MFSGGFTLDSAELICTEGDGDSYEVLDLLSSLVDKSLIVKGTLAYGKRLRKGNPRQ